MKIFSLAASAAMLVACGDDLTNGKYQGEPRFQISGEIRSLDNTTTPGAQAYVGLSWPYDHGAGDQAALQTVAVSASSFPTSFTLALYDVPPAEAVSTD